MLLNHEIGEIVEGMDDIFLVVPVSKYAEQTRLTTVVERVRGKKFKRKVQVEMPIFQAAMEHARDAFTAAGLMPGASIDCIAQEYYRTDCVCFVFAALINGEARFVTAPFKLGHEQIADLKLRGLWKPYRVN
jgi:hypothetical protein